MIVGVYVWFQAGSKKNFKVPIKYVAVPLGHSIHKCAIVRPIQYSTVELILLVLETTQETFSLYASGTESFSELFTFLVVHTFSNNINHVTSFYSLNFVII